MWYRKGGVRYTVVHNPETEHNFTIAGLMLPFSATDTHKINTTSYYSCCNTHYYQATTLDYFA